LIAEVKSDSAPIPTLMPEVWVNHDRYAVLRPRTEVEELIAMDRSAPNP
jgi:diaminopimelate decarboxylase